MPAKFGINLLLFVRRSASLFFLSIRRLALQVRESRTREQTPHLPAAPPQARCPPAVPQRGGALTPAGRCPPGHAPSVGGAARPRLPAGGASAAPPPRGRGVRCPASTWAGRAPAPPGPRVLEPCPGSPASVAGCPLPLWVRDTHRPRPFSQGVSLGWRADA